MACASQPTSIRTSLCARARRAMATTYRQIGTFLQARKTRLSPAVEDDGQVLGPLMARAPRCRRSHTLSPKSQRRIGRPLRARRKRRRPAKNATPPVDGGAPRSDDVPGHRLPGP